VNASPDLRAQLETYPELRPDSSSFRNSPIAGVLLTNADLDHVLGLFLLREGGPLEIHAPNAVRSTLENSLGLSTILDAMCGTAWHEPPTRQFRRLASGGSGGDLSYRAIELPGLSPRFVSKRSSAGVHAVAYEFRNEQTGALLVVAPDVPSVNDSLRKALMEADAVLFDGTFWSSNELSAVKRNAPAAKEMGHLTIKDSSLALLAGLKARQKIYVHINNTNPILALGSPERAEVEAAGVVVGYDGLEFEL
jgi:pyrroloquinoline quinone biosynthesis protein B